MSRSQRRRFDSEFQKVLRTKGDNCNLCGRPFQHNDRTHGGFSMRDKVVVVGDCCRDKLATIYGGGVFSTRNNDVLSAKAGTKKAADAPMLKAGDLEKTISGIQAHFEDLDKLSAKVMRQAGVSRSKERTSVSLATTPWKTDDAAWFDAHPGRSHRLRPAFPDEFKHLEHEFGEMPEHHEVQTLVRQVEVGTRIRTPFGRDLRTEIPDLEPVLHALYDLVAQRNPAARNLSVSDVAELAMKYAAAQDEGHSGPKN